MARRKPFSGCGDAMFIEQGLKGIWISRNHLSVAIHTLDRWKKIESFFTKEVEFPLKADSLHDQRWRTIPVALLKKLNKERVKGKIHSSCSNVQINLHTTVIDKSLSDNKVSNIIISLYLYLYSYEVLIFDNLIKKCLMHSVI